MVGRRKDGYHNLESFFQAVSLGDQLALEFSKNDQFLCQDPELEFNDQNLIIRALSLFRKKTYLKDSVSISLDKKIPKQAGLGGGSSNAATMLWGLNELFDKVLPVEELIELSKELGSDVPFFFSKGSALCTGRGDQVDPMPKPCEDENVWVVKPNYSLSTQEVYTFSNKQSLISDNLEALSRKIYSQLPVYQNDLEKAAFLLCPALALLKDELEMQGFKHVFMTGSGTAYICIGKNQPTSKSFVQIFPIEYINRESNAWYQRLSYANR